jgi:hypothetical protein
VNTVPEVLVMPQTGTGYARRGPKRFLAFLLHHAAADGEEAYVNWKKRFDNDFLMAKHNFTLEDYELFLMGVLALGLPITKNQRRRVEVAIKGVNLRKSLGYSVSLTTLL